MSKLLNMSQVRARYNDCSRTTIYNWMRDKGFPQGALGPKGRLWSEDSLNRFDRRFGSSKDSLYARQ